jgi:electron-transferring-flavoprotein dehydrogenase
MNSELIDDEAMHFDVIIVGAGVAGLSAAIRLKQKNADINVCVLEKGSEVGAHIISGAILEPRALHELFPDWESLGAPLYTPVQQEQVLMLTQKNCWHLPHWLLPSLLGNQGNYIISLANLCRWLAEQAEQLGVEIYSGFAAAKVLFTEDGAVKGVVTGEMGLDKQANPKPEYEAGLALYATYTLFAEGCRGSLSEQLIKRFKLRQQVKAAPQNYYLGIKELWEVDEAQHQAGLVTHTFGWPLDRHTYGGAFIYHLENNQVAMGLVVGLDYKNPYLNPFNELQRLKTHPAIRPLFAGGRRIAYGARALNRGGIQSLPMLSFPGGALLGASAGFLNIAKLKGAHTAMKSGITIADVIIDEWQHKPRSAVLTQYNDKMRRSWACKELYQVRNSRPAYARWGMFGKFFVEKILGGKEPFTLTHSQEDHQALEPKTQYQPIDYPRPDGKISFDLPSSVALANTCHEENQPVHLRLKEATIPISVNFTKYDAPEQRYCPAGVYEIIKDKQTAYLQINAANCLHCKICEIKDPQQNIVWTVPEGGGGPNYPGM